MKTVLLSLLFSTQIVFGQQASFRFHGLKIYVNDMRKAEKFYSDFLGFTIETNKESFIVTGQSFPIFIQKSQERSEVNYPLEARTSLALQVDKLLPAIDLLRANELTLYDTLLERNGVGIAIPFQDYSGNVMSFIEVQVFNSGPVDEIRTYNCGVTISDMDKASRFYLDILGFKEWSRGYLPAALPLKHKDGSFAFMIHKKEGLLPNSSQYAKAPQMSLLMTTADLKHAYEYLKKYKIEILNEDIKQGLVCKDFEGNIVEIKENFK